MLALTNDHGDHSSCYLTATTLIAATPAGYWLNERFSMTRKSDAPVTRSAFGVRRSAFVLETTVR
jgi:hypothetical protein